MLEHAGLSAMEIRGYRYVIGKRECTRAELCQELGLADVSALVATLVAKGLITVTGGDTLTANPPDVAGEVLVLKRMAQLQAARAEFARLAEEYRTAALRSPSAAQLIEMVPRESVPQLNDQLNRQAEHDVMWVNAPPYLAPATVWSEEMNRLKAGVRYRCIYARAMLDEPGMLEILRPYMAAGEQARVIDSVPLKLGIVDRKVALLPLLTGSSSTAVSWLLVHQCSLLDALVALFETMWLTALPLDGLLAINPEAAQGDPRADTPQLLALLLAGLTDEAIARQLGIGKRTVVRRVRQLMDRAGVTTRLQLGWQAAQLGWINNPGAGPGSRST